MANNIGEGLTGAARSTRGSGPQCRAKFSHYSEPRRFHPEVPALESVGNTTLADAPEIVPLEDSADAFTLLRIRSPKCHDPWRFGNSEEKKRILSTKFHARGQRVG